MKKKRNPSRRNASDVLNRARRIRVLLMDVDGVLTDGRVYLQSSSDGVAHEMKAFHAHDGVGLKLARACGIQTGVITGRESVALVRRAKETEMDFVYQKQAIKVEAYEEILSRAGVSDAEVAFVGDDLPDIPLLQRVGLGVAVQNAAVEVKAAARFVTRSRGGEGAVREVIELLLRAQGVWEEAVGKARA